MYRGTDPNQMYLDDFNLQFGGKLRVDNRWVKLSKQMPWDRIEEIYERNFSKDSGVKAIKARIAFGAIYAKEQEEWTDRETVQNFLENPYFQYFLGFSEFQERPAFDSSMMVYFRKRFPKEAINEINELIFLAAAQEPGDKDDPKDPGTPGSGEKSESKSPEKKGKLILDATCAPADIRYPTDLSLLDESRANVEKISDMLLNPSSAQKRRNQEERKKARRAFLEIIRQKRPGIRKIKAAIKKQLKYIRKNIDVIDEYLHENGLELLEEKHMQRFMTICDIYHQQSTMLKNNTRQCEERIVSLRQPHLRPIVRGKAGKKYEFGQKMALSVIGGYTFIEEQSFENFNEATLLIESVEKYKEHFGFYPEAVLADQIYRNQKNINYCKKHGIRISGSKLGQPGIPPEGFSGEHDYKDYCERNIVEGRIGTSKRRFGLDLIMCYLPETALTEAALQVLCTNFSVWLSFLCSFFNYFRLRFFRFGFSFV